MTEIDLNSLLKQSMTKENLDTLLKDWGKYNQIFDRVNETLTKLEKLGILPAIIRVAGKRAGIENIDAPLRNEMAVIAISPVHRSFFELCNQLQNNDIFQLMNLVLNAQKQSQINEKDKGNDKVQGDEK